MKTSPRIHNTFLLLTAFLMTAISASGATKAWTGAAGDMLWSSSGNWLPTGVPGPADNVTFTNAGATDSSIAVGGSVNNIVDAGFLTPINSLGYMNSNVFHNTQLINNLSVIGTSATDVAYIADDGEPAVFFVGNSRWQDDKDATVYATIIGNGLTVSNRFANLSVCQISATSGGHRATLDLTGLDSLTCTVSNVLVGYNFTQPDHAWRPTGELFLARSNSITSRAISVSDAYQNAGAACFLHLGAANVVNVDKIRIGMHKCVGTLDFAPGLDARSAVFRDATGNGRQTSWELGDEFEPSTNLLFGFFTSNQARGTIDLSAATVDALVDRIVLGRGQIQRDATVRNGDGNGTLTFGGGTIDANTIEMGIQVPGPFIGGSVGNGILNVNNDVGVGPATLIVRSNLLMTVQQPGNTDPAGSTAVLNIDGGKVMVGGDILDGGGVSTINLSNGGKLDLQPTGDLSPGNISIDTLNITDGSVTNFAILAATSISLLGAEQTFTIYAGQSIAPAGAGVLGTLTVTGNITLRGETLMDIGKAGGVLIADRLAASGTIDPGGVLKVRLTGDAKLAAGDKFTLFSAGLAHAFSSVNLPSPGAGLGWANKLVTDGTIEVVATGEPLTPPVISIEYSLNSVHLSWPTTYTSFSLFAQTNALTVGIRSNWVAVPGVSGNQLTFAPDRANGTVFFRLVQE